MESRREGTALPAAAGDAAGKAVPPAAVSIEIRENAEPVVGPTNEEANDAHATPVLPAPVTLIA
jgi:hypothetical protein